MAATKCSLAWMTRSLVGVLGDERASEAVGVGTPVTVVRPSLVSITGGTWSKA